MSDPENWRDLPPPMDTLGGEIAHIYDQRGAKVLRQATSNRARCKNGIARVRRGAVQLLVEDIDAHVEGLGHISLGACANSPGIPVCCYNPQQPC